MWLKIKKQLQNRADDIKNDEYDRKNKGKSAG